jgi:large subunit ribosomal protein L15
MADHILSRLQPPKGAVKKKKRVGRGPGSGLGKTAGRGHKGQGARSGGKPHPRFEGGQMPLQRRLPKRGFTNVFRHEYHIVNLRDLQGFAANTVVDVDALAKQGLLPKSSQAAGLKVLGDGEISVALIVKAHRFSASARQKIEAAGGTVEVIESA